MRFRLFKTDLLTLTNRKVGTKFKRQHFLALKVRKIRSNRLTEFKMQFFDTKILINYLNFSKIWDESRVCLEKALNCRDLILRTQNCVIDAVKSKQQQNNVENAVLKDWKLLFIRIFPMRIKYLTLSDAIP